MLILQHAAVDDDVKVLVWTGRGRAFSSGADMSRKKVPPQCKLREDAMTWFKEDAGFTPGPENGDMALKCLTMRFWAFPKPSIAAINGLAGNWTTRYQSENTWMRVACLFRRHVV